MYRFALFNMGERKHSDAKLVTTKKDVKEFMIYNYRHSFSGFAAHLTWSQAKLISIYTYYIPHGCGRNQSHSTTDG